MDDSHKCSCGAECTCDGETCTCPADAEHNCSCDSCKAARSSADAE